ncbi:MAG: hypothetical protein L0G70_01075 [Rubrobacter sp.]|nr:hypothetical protein [Rubrobacter sp.]
MTAICHGCGQEWPRHPALEVECPQCGAAEGRGCKRPSDHAGPFVEPHAAREQAAVDQGVLELCPEGPTRKAQHSQPALLDTA